jgi:hypothetical protein
MRLFRENCVFYNGKNLLWFIAASSCACLNFDWQGITLKICRYLPIEISAKPLSLIIHRCHIYSNLTMLLIAHHFMTVHQILRCGRYEVDSISDIGTTHKHFHFRLRISLLLSVIVRMLESIVGKFFLGVLSNDMTDT